MVLRELWFASVGCPNSIKLVQNILNIYFVKLFELNIQWNPLSVITLGLRETDNIIWMITISTSTILKTLFGTWSAWLYKTFISDSFNQFPLYLFVVCTLKKNYIVNWKNIRWYANFFLLVWWYVVDKRFGTPALDWPHCNEINTVEAA